MRTIRRHRDGNPRYTRFMFVNATRCLACHVPIVLVVVQGPSPRFLPVDASSWDGSSYYIKGKHRVHFRSCPSFLRMVGEYKSLRDSDLIVELPEGYE